MSEKEEDNNKDWKETTERFVGFLDIMGFKDMVMHKEHDEIVNILKSISDYVIQLDDSVSHYKFVNSMDDDVDDDSFMCSYNDSIKGTIRAEIFSDSIIIFTKDDTVESFRNFLIVLSEIMYGRLNSENPIPLKGACAFGRITIDTSKRIFFGQPLIDAYLLQEKEVYYYGVACHHSIDRYIENKSKIDEVIQIRDLLLFESKIPLKTGRVTHTNLNYFLYFGYSTNLHSKWDTVIRNLKCSVSGSPRRYIDNTQSVFNALNEEGMFKNTQFCKFLFFSLIKHKCFHVVENYINKLNIIGNLYNYKDQIDSDVYQAIFFQYDNFMTNEAALSFFNQAICYDNDNNFLRILRGLLLFDIERFKDAINDFEYLYKKLNNDSASGGNFLEIQKLTLRCYRALLQRTPTGEEKIAYNNRILDIKAEMNKVCNIHVTT